MNLDGIKIKPAEGKLAVKFIDGEEEDEVEAASSSPPVSYEGVLAIVVAVGAKVTGVKDGDTVVMRSWARQGLKVGDNLFICDGYDVAATLTG